MENPCYKCGQPVEQGVPFCRHCSAPQIRVVMAEPLPSPVASADVFTTSPASANNPAAQTLEGAVLSMPWSQAIQACALAALVATLLMGPVAAALNALGLSPVVAMIILGFGDGFLAVIFYRRRRPGTPINALAGVKLGALCGALWFGMASILEALIVTSLHKAPEFRNELIGKIQEAATRTTDPQAIAVLERFKTPDGLVFLMFVTLIFAFFIALILAGLGGALGGVILGSKDKP